MKEFAVCLGTPHRLREPGKQSPDKSLREPVYCRELIAELKPLLQSYGIKTFVDMEELDLPKNMQTPSVTLERQRELGLRVNYVNLLAKKFNLVYISIHNDASGSDGKWHEPNGWSVRVSPKASENSKILANFLWDTAKEYGLNMRRYSSTQKYIVQNLYVLNNTSCPAVLTENLFQDNRQDVKFLLSDEGRHVLQRIYIEGILKYKEYITKEEKL